MTVRTGPDEMLRVRLRRRPQTWLLTGCAGSEAACTGIGERPSTSKQTLQPIQ